MYGVRSTLITWNTYLTLVVACSLRVAAALGLTVSMSSSEVEVYVHAAKYMLYSRLDQI